MNQWNTLNGDTAIFVHHLSLGGINRIERHFVSQVVGIELELSVQFLAQFFRCMHMQLSRTSQQTKSRNHANQAKAVIAMQVGNKHMTELIKTHPALSQLHLGTLGTIKHQYLLAYFYNLRRGIMA